MKQPATAVVALGSNLGDRRGHLQWAVTKLGESLAGLTVSAIVETEPVDVPDEQPPYLNAVAFGLCDRSPHELFGRLQRLELERNRTRTGWRSARTLDLDLILFGDQVIGDDTLIVPHPRFRERRFVLEPLAEIAPHLRDPVSGLTVVDLLRRLAPIRT